MDNNKFIILILSILLAISISFNIHYNITDKNVKIEEKVTIVEKVDTIRDTIPVVQKERFVKYVIDTLQIHDTLLTHDSVIVDIPITQKEYKKDSLYVAWVSGYKPQLDSINVYQKNVYITKEKTITKKDNHKFGIGPVIYGGYDIGSKQIGYGIGIGISYHIWEW